MAENLTPMFRQYRGIKRQYPDVILFFRLGDFYEMFEEDAVVASRELDLVLTARPESPKSSEKIPMCGVPFHAVDRYVARLIAKGFRVAICDQVEDPALAKQLVKREVTRVVTPGTIVEDAMLDAKANNYLVALAFPEGTTGRRGEGGAPPRSGGPGRRGEGTTARGNDGARGRRGDGANGGGSPDDGASGEETGESASPAVAPAAIGLAVCDLSTGEFAVTEFTGPEPARATAEELARLRPAELLVTEEALERGKALAADLSIAVSPLKAEVFPRRAARESLLRHFGVQSLRGFGCEEMPLAVEAAAAVLCYLQETKLPAVEHIRSMATYTTAGFMALDATARRNLELVQSMWEGGRSRTLLSILDATCTAMGGRLLRRWLERPLLDVPAINARLDAVEELCRSALLRGELRDCLGHIADLERLISRCATGTANARDLLALRLSLEAAPPILEALAEVGAERLRSLRDSIDPVADLVELIARAIHEEPPATLREGGLIRDGYSETLDNYRTESRVGKEWIANLEAEEREKTGIKSLKVGYNDVFKYYIEVTKPNLAYVPEDRYIRRQTTANAERYITAELKEQESRILGAEKRAVEMEYSLFCQIREQVGRAAARVLATAAAVAELDVLASHAESASRYGYTRPLVDDGAILHIRNGRHPVVERLGSEPFVPNDVLMDEQENRLLVITGPNMSGKSTFLRQVALICLMAQAGSMVPADAAQIGVVDRIFTRVGAHDDLASGQSTFMVEMNETAAILNNATRRSLVILDEIGRGTSTFDGLSIAWAVAEYLQQLAPKTLFATHYHHLNDLAERLPGVRNYRVAVREDGHRIVWLRKIVPGGTDKSYGIQVARLAGLPDAVIRRAREVLEELERGGRNGGVPDGVARVTARTERMQLTLFEAEEHPVLELLRGLDVSTMTPIEALTALYELQKKL
jgi:DNA mismatch repair protein MutS